MTLAAPIPRLSLHEALAPRIRTMIVEGEIPTGQRINERALCDRFQVSRTPLREALKVLAAEGYVQLTPNRGATVQELTLPALEETFTVLAQLEALAGELAVQTATDAELDGIVALTRAMRRAHDQGDRHAYFAANEGVHKAIAAASGNATLGQMQRSLDGRVRVGRYRASTGRARWDAAMAEHEAIAAALVARDGPGVAALLRTHILNKLAALRLVCAPSAPPD